MKNAKAVYDVMSNLKTVHAAIKKAINKQRTIESPPLTRGGLGWGSISAWSYPHPTSPLAGGGA